MFDPGIVDLVTAVPLSDLCTASNVNAAITSNGTLIDISPVPSLTTASTVNGSSTSTNSSYYCSVTVAYTHSHRDDLVHVRYAFPQPSEFQNRFYVTGGGGYSLSNDPTEGLKYGAAGGATDGGYNGFEINYDAAVLLGNGSINWDATYMFGYEALGEMTKLGKVLTRGFYDTSSDQKIYTYFEGCSDGGREGMSQVQRWGTEYDGVIAGAPAFRFAQQQVLHVFPSAVEHTLDYYPPPCALAKIVNATIAACDALDGRIDGVVSRSDLCNLQFDLTSIIGTPYYCEANTFTSASFDLSNNAKRLAGNRTQYQQPAGRKIPPRPGSPGSPGSSGSKAKRQTGGIGTLDRQTSFQPVQNGTVTAQDVEIVQAIYDGLFNSAGQRAYLSWQIASELPDAEPTYDKATSSWNLNIPSVGGEYVTRFIQLVNSTNLANLDGVTYDTLVSWIGVGMDRYYDSLQGTYPDLTAFQSSGGKLLHYHGEADPSIPAASSVHYWQSVRSIMYGGSSNLTEEDSLAQLSDWYQFYVVPGAAHCKTNALQEGSPYPQDNMKTMIDWVENGITPSSLSAVVSSGPYKGEIQELCQWPTRPLWQGNSSSFDCVYDQRSVDSWTYTFDAFKLPVY